MANKKPMTPHMRLSEIANQTARYTDNAIAEAYNLGYQAAESNAEDMAKAGIEPAGPYKPSIDELTAQIDHLKRANDGLAARLLERPSIKPEDMQDGKRYQVTIEGTYKLPAWKDEGIFENEEAVFSDEQIESATRIEEI